MRLHQFAVSGFAYKLTQTQREALLQLLVQMAGVDYEISVEEEAFLVEWATEWQLPLDITPESPVDDATLLAHFQDFSAKIIALQEMVKLGYQDGHFGDEERAKVQAASLRLGIHNPQVVGDINRWVRKWYDWHYAGEQMLANESWTMVAND
ncbi:MAG: TerB family tellurite resistance protein [Thiotrichales bacterium]|jgi:uncharacterized tellurite resistance protein B-like protein|nr:TerB family tellurite resistance protein [Thiotrichales bacterium]